MPNQVPFSVATSSRWGGHNGLSFLAPILLTILALAGVVVTRDWRFGLGAPILAVWAFWEVRERRSISRSAARLMLDHDRLIIPLRRRGSWVEKSIAVGDIEKVTAFESARGIESIILFRASPQGGLIGLGAIHVAWFRWEGVEPASFYAALSQRVEGQATNRAAP